MDAPAYGYFRFFSMVKHCFFGLLFSCLLALGLSGCYFFRKKDVLAKPVDSFVYITATSSMNRDVIGRPSPVVVKVYQLKSDGKFQNLDFFSLYTSPDQKLGADLIDIKTTIIAPNQVKKLSQKIWPNTQFIAIVAAYREIGSAKWKGTLPFHHNVKHENFSLTLGTSRMSFRCVHKDG